MIITIICNILLGLFVIFATLLNFFFILAIFVGISEQMEHRENKKEQKEND